MNIATTSKPFFCLTFVVLCLFVGLFSSCDQPFDPRAGLEKRLVVYSVLSTDRDVQYARVERDYMPGSYDPLTDSADHSVTAADVRLWSSGLTYAFQDTTLERADISRYEFPIRSYFLKPFRISYGASYKLTVLSSAYDKVFATILVPGKPQMALTPVSVDILDRPGSHQDGDEIIVTINIGEGAIGLIGRLFLDYEVLGGEFVSARTEVPVSYAYSGLKDFRFIRFAELTRSGSNHVSASIYLNELYLKNLTDIGFQQHPNTKIIFERVVFQLTQVDQNLYTYYRVAHAYNDPHSTRLDEPLFSNVAGGVGVIGAYTVDSLVHVLPENFVGNRY